MRDINIKTSGIISAIISSDKLRRQDKSEDQIKSRYKIQKTCMADNSLIKFLYAIFLRELDNSLIIAFFESHPLPIADKSLSIPEMVKRFWKPGGKIPLSYYCSVFQDIEPFFAENGLCFKNALRRALEDKLFLDVKTWLSLICHAPELVLTGNQIQIILMELLCHFLYMFCPAVKCTMLGSRYNVGEYRYTFMLDPGYEKFPALEFSTIFGMLIKYLPVRFNESAYDDVVCHTERMTIDSIDESWSGNNILSGFQLSDPELYGHHEDFYEYVSRLGFDLSKSVAPYKVFVMDRDYQCSDKKRTLLKKGTALGAPFYLFTIVYRDRGAISHFNSGSFLKLLNRELLFPSRTKHFCVEKLHKELIKTFEVPVAFRYVQNTGSIYFENDFITSGVQARLLLYILQKYVSDGTCEFSRKEFVYNNELISSPENTGFAVRLTRVQEMLNRFNTPIRIEKKERGRFHLKTKRLFILLHE